MASGWSASDQSSRDSPSAEVSPETPALITVTSYFCAFSAACNWTVNSVPGGRP